MPIDVKAIQNLQSRIVAAAQGYDITELDVRMNDNEFYVCVKGVKKGVAPSQPITK